MKHKRFLCGAIMLTILVGLVLPVTASAEETNMSTSLLSPEGYEYAIFPLKCGHLSQLRYVANNSHADQNAVDWVPLTKEGYADNNAVIYAPFTGKIVNYDTSNYGLVVFQSNDKVKFADGTVDIMTLKFGHDNNASCYERDKTIKQGEPLCYPGTAGNVGYHSHIAVQKGAWDGSTSGSGNYDIEKALFLDTDWTIDWTPNGCYYYNALNWTALPKGYLGMCSFYPASFTVTVKEAHENIWSLPTISTENGSTALTEIIKKGTKLTVSGIYYNTFGNYWYKVEAKVGGKTVKGFFNSGYTDYKSIKFINDVGINNFAAPSYLSVGQAFDIGGRVYANGCRIKSISTCIYEGNSTSGNALYSPSVNVDTYDYEIGGDPVLDWQLYFNNLPAGNYTYAVKAVIENDYTTASKSFAENTYDICIRSQQFTVG